MAEERCCSIPAGRKGHPEAHGPFGLSCCWYDGTVVGGVALQSGDLVLYVVAILVEVVLGVGVVVVVVVLVALRWF